MRYAFVILPPDVSITYRFFGISGCEWQFVMLSFSLGKVRSLC